MTYGDKIDVILEHVNKHIRKWFITVDEKLDLILERLNKLEESEPCNCHQDNTAKGTEIYTLQGD